MYQIRLFDEADRLAIEALSARLLIGMAHWRDPDACLVAIHNWLEASMDRDESEGTLLVARNLDGDIAGFISIELSTHFSGEPQATIGELVVDEDVEGQGIGRQLVEAAEQWARMRQLSFLTLVTGAANQSARGFYRQLGFLEEEVRLTKLLG